MNETNLIVGDAGISNFLPVQKFTRALPFSTNLFVSFRLLVLDPDVKINPDLWPNFRSRTARYHVRIRGDQIMIRFELSVRWRRILRLRRDHSSPFFPITFQLKI